MREGNDRKEHMHYFGHRQRLRERFLKTGLGGFSEHEIVELILTLAIPRKDVKQPAKALLSKFRNLRGIMDATPEELMQIQGVGSVAPVALKIIAAMSELYLQQHAVGISKEATFEKLHDLWKLKLGGAKEEWFEAAFLSSKHELLPDGIETLSHGTTDQANVYPRKIAEAALRKKAAAVILAHNHTNGSITPSENDKLLTRSADLALEAIGIRLVDHLIITSDDYFSFKKGGLL